MFMKCAVLIPILLMWSALSYAQEDQPLSGKYSQGEIRATTTDSTSPLNGPVIGDKKTAIAVAEAILFPIYGKRGIRSQRPYHVKLEDGYWKISGHLTHGMQGGVFIIILRAKDAQVVKLSHSK